MGWRKGWTALVVTSLARALVLLALALGTISVVPAAFGWVPTVVMTNSMAPVIRAGDVMISRPVPASDLRFGQVLLVDDPDQVGELRLHRLVAAAAGGRLVLRGDRNAHRDSSTVALSAVRGIAVLRVPLIGHPFLWAEQRDLPALAGVGGVASLVLGCSMLFRPGRDREPPAHRLAGKGPHSRRRPHGRRRKGFAPTAGVAAGLLLIVAGATPADAAPISAITSNSGDTYASAARFTCSDRFAVDSPIDYWKLAEANGTTAVDQRSTRPGTYSSTGVTYGDAGPCPADRDSAVTLSGEANVGVSTAVPVDTSTLTSFTEEIAFRTTTTAGGSLMGLWASSTASAGVRDRVITMSTSGQIVFGMVDAGTGGSVLATSPASYNDGLWHLAAARYSPTGGLRLFVDGGSVATAPAVSDTTAQSMYWRHGFGDVTTWVPSGSSAPVAAFTGSIADAVVYASALSTTRLTNHAQAFSGAQNYAEGRTATQSSDALGGVAGRAVDGNTEGTFANGSVTHTNTDPYSWWQVDLRYTITTSQLRIWNRTDCCGSRLSDYRVFVSAAPFDTTLTPTQQAAQPGVWSTRLTTAPSPSTTITPPAGTRGRYVMVQLQTASTNLSLAEVQVYGSAPTSPSVDIAIGSAASQSSTLYSGFASRAVDDNTDGTFNDGSVSHTDADPNSWWRTDLGASRSMGSIGVWGRMDCCSSRLSDFWVFVSNTPFTASLSPSAQAAQSGVWSVHLTAAPMPMTTITLPGGTTGRYVMVQEQTSNQNLSLAEVQIFGPSP